MRGNDALGDCQSQSGAFVARLTAPVTVKDVMKVLARDAWPVIRHSEEDFARATLDPDRDRPRAHLERVTREIGKNLGDAISVTFHRVATSGHVHVQATAALGRQRLKGLDDVADKR